MVVLCIYNEGQYLSNKTLEVIKYDDTLFFLKINEQYTVYGMAIWAGVLHYLVVDIWGRPSWFPAGLFAVLEDIIPEHFHFKFYRKYELSAVWGYRELLDEQHYDCLIERQDEDLAIFFANKKILDKQATEAQQTQEAIRQPIVCDILQWYNESKMSTSEFITAFNDIYNKFFSKNLNKKYQNMFDTLYGITQTYKPTSDQDEQLKKSMQKLYFSINFPHTQFKHQ